MAALHGSVNVIDDYVDDDILEEEHEFETFAQEFIEQDDWHEAATDRNNFEEILTLNEHQEQHPMNILNIAEPVICIKEIQKIPSVLEVIDLKNKVFKVSAVALMKAPIMMCH